MAITPITLIASDNGDLPRLIFTAVGNFGLGADFPSLYKRRSFDSLNFESTGMLADGLMNEITNTSGKVFQFKAMPLSEMTGDDMAVVSAFGEDIVVGGGTQAEWTEQLDIIIDTKLNLRRIQG